MDEGKCVGVASKCRGAGVGFACERDLCEYFVTFPDSLSIDFACAKQAGKVTNRNHGIWDTATFVNASWL